jgi:hypothetical protein
VSPSPDTQQIADLLSELDVALGNAQRAIHTTLSQVHRLQAGLTVGASASERGPNTATPDAPAVYLALHRDAVIARRATFDAAYIAALQGVQRTRLAHDVARLLTGISVGELTVAPSDDDAEPADP